MTAEGRSIEISRLEKQPSTTTMTQQAHQLRGYLQVKHNAQTRGKRLMRKCWRRQWMVLDIVESGSTAAASSSSHGNHHPALIARIYGSHIHEDKSLPQATLTIPDVHALHRTQSRSHQFAFSVDGGLQNGLVLSGSSETESQLWMRHIRDLLWPRSTTPMTSNGGSWPKQDTVFEVGLIDNVYSDIARFRGFYGHLVVSSAGDNHEILLVEARSGADQVRWPIDSVKKWFCATRDTVTKKEDRDKIVVLITHKSCPSGEGIFTFFSSRARDIVKAINNAHNTNIEQKKKRKQQLKLQDKRRNPLLSFLRRSSTATSNRRGTSTSPKRAAAGSKSASTTLTKSISVMEHLKPDPGPTERQRVQQRQREDEPVEGGFVNNGDKSSAFANKARRSASESDLLGCKINAVDDESDEDENETTTKRTITVTAEINEGFYRSFDDDIDDIDDLVELRSGAKAKTKANGGQTLAPSCEDDSSARRSFQSTDSGRASNASETTCNSSVASSSNGSSTACNRIYSNNSNCSSSVDSGTHVSVGSDCSSSKLEVLREQREAIYGGGMKKIDDTEDEEDDDPTYSRITTREAETVEMMSLSSVPPPLPPRFATVRKSFTLPHNMNNCANEAIYAVVPRRQQRSKEAANNTNNEGLECDQEPASNLSAQKNEDIRRSRPKSLGFTMVQSMEVQAHKNVNIAKDPRVLNKALFRLSLDNSSYRSAPTTPDLTNNQLLKNGSPRKKTLARFLGNDGKASPSYPSLPPPPPNGILKKSSLSNSTPMDLESFQDDQSNDRDLEESHDEEEDVYQDVCRRKSRWQSNDGLATPGSLGGGCCTPNSTSFLTPAGSPRGGPRFEAVAANNNHNNNVCGPKQSSSMFSLTCAALPSPLAAAHGATGGQQQQFPPQPMQQRPRFSAGENRSNSLQREGSATLQPVSLRGRSKPLPPAPPLRIGSLPRSATLNDLELRHASMPPPPPPASVVWVPRSGAPTSTQIRRHSLHLNHRHHNQHLSSTAIKRRSSSSMNRGEDAVVSEEDIPAGHFQRGSVGRRSTRKGSVDDGGNRKQCGCPCDHHHNHQKHHQQKEDIYGYKSEPESVYMDMRKAAASSDPMTVTRALVHKELDATALK